MDSKNIKIYVTFEEKKIPLDISVKTFEELKNFIRSKFSSLPEKIRIFYIDQDNDEITISCDGDLESFDYEEKDIEINIKPYSDSDATDNDESEGEFDDEDEEEEEVVSSCCDSDSGEERSKSMQKQVQIPIEQQNDANVVEQKNQPQEKKENVEVEVEAEVEEEEQKQDNSAKKDSSIQHSPDQIKYESNECGTSPMNSEKKDQSNQASTQMKNSEQQVIVEQCDQSFQAQVNLCDASGQTNKIEQNDHSIQIQVESKDIQTQSQVEQKDLSLQTMIYEQKDHGTQFKCEQKDHELQADVIQQEDFQSQAYQINHNSIGSQPLIPLYSAVGINTDELNQSQGKLYRNLNQEVQNNQLQQESESRIKSLEDNLQKLMTKLSEYEKRNEERINQIENKNILNDSFEEMIKQQVEIRVNELLPEYSRANWDNFRKQERLSRFDRIFQECSPQYNKLAFMTDASQIGAAYDDLTSMLIQKLEIARDMYLKELNQNQSSKLNNINQSQIKDNNKVEIKKNDNLISQNKEEDEQEEKKEMPEAGNNVQNKKRKIFEPMQIENPLILQKQESSNKYGDDSAIEARLKQYQQKMRDQKQSEDENIKRILEEKEREAMKLNQEIIANLHKDYPSDVVEKANQLAQLTQSNPNMYLQYVLDYKQQSLNDLMDQLFNPNIIEKYHFKQ